MSMYPEVSTNFIYNTEDKEYEVFGTLECESPFSTYRENGELYVEFFDDAVITNIHYFNEDGDQVFITKADDMYEEALEFLIEAHEDEVRENFEED